jgi:hypothetical protein
VKNVLQLIRRRAGKHVIESEVDEELNFHIDTQTDDYEHLGLSREDSRAMAEARFGDVERIRTECIRIGSGKSVLIWILNSVFLMSLLVGLLLRALIPEMHVNRVGDVMMMIGGLGILLVYAKQAGTSVFSPNKKSLQLGLNSNTPPPSFDEQGRTPFDRVRSDE